MRNIKIIIIIVLLIILLIVGILLYISYNKPTIDSVGKQEDMIASENIIDDIEILNNRNLFFTVSNCVNRYIENIVKKEDVSVYAMLDKDYINENRITAQNIWNYVDKFSTKQVFTARRIHLTELDNYHSIFYVYGTVREDKEDQMTKESDFYITVKLDYENSIFSIIPFEYPKEQIGNMK